MTMRTLRLLAAAAAALCLTAAAVPAAHAAAFTMTSCTAGQPHQGPWEARPHGVAATNFCDMGEGLLLWPVTLGQSTPYAGDAKWQLNLPSTLRVRGVRGQIRLNQGAGWAAGLHAEDLGRWLYGGPDCLGQCGNGVWTTFELFGLDSRVLSFIQLCYAASCPSGYTSAIRDLVVTLDDLQ